MAREPSDDIPASGPHTLHGTGKGEQFNGAGFSMAKESFASGLSINEVRGLKDAWGENIDPETHPVWKNYKDLVREGVSPDDAMRAFSLSLSMAQSDGAKLDGQITLNDYQAAYNNPDAVVARANKIIAGNEYVRALAEPEKTVAPATSTQAATVQQAPAKDEPPAFSLDEKVSLEKRTAQYEEEMRTYLLRQMDAQLERDKGQPLTTEKLQSYFKETVKGPVTPDFIREIAGEYEGRVKTYNEKHPAQTAPATAEPAAKNTTAPANHEPVSPGTPCTMSDGAKAFAQICQNKIGTPALKDVWETASDVRSEFKSFDAFKAAVAADTKAEAARARAFEGYYDISRNRAKERGMEEKITANGTSVDSAAMLGAVGVGNMDRALDADKANDPKPIDGLKEVMDRAGVKMESGKDVEFSIAPAPGSKDKARTAALQDR